MLFAVILFLPVISYAQLNQHEIGYIPDFGLGGDASIEEIVGNIIQLFLGFLGFVALVIIIVAGFKWMTSGGNEEKISKAKKMLVAGIIGLAIILASYIITVFLMRTFLGITNPSDGPDGPTGCNNPGSCVGCQICGEDGFLHMDENCYSACTQGANPNTLQVNWKKPTATDVSLCTMIQVGFNYDINSSSVNNTTFQVNKCNGNVCDQSVPGAFTVDGDVIQFRPANNYDANSTYRVNLPASGITSGEGENTISLLSSETWDFTTGASVDTQSPKVTFVTPIDGATEVCRNSNIKVKFSKDMDVLSLKNASSTSLFGRAPDSNSNFTEQNIQFTRKIYSSDTVYLKPISNYTEDFEYAPLLNSQIIKDSCGNPLDGNGNNTQDGAPSDNYPPNNNHDAWNFFTGRTLECRPTVESDGVSAYYDGSDVIITGTYLEGSSLVFNNEIILNSSSGNICMGANGSASVACSQTSDWQDDRIKIKVPAITGISNGAKSGDIKIITQYNRTLTTDFTLLSPRIDGLVSPNIGGGGQFITIRGQNFGASQGGSMVYFRKNNQDIPAEFPCGANSWRDNRIIISVPESMTDLGSWDIQIKKIEYVAGEAGSDGQATIIEEEHWSNITNFTLTSSSAGPGLCEVNPEDVEYDDEFTLTGKMLGTATGEARKVILGNQYTSQDAVVVNWLGETGNSESTEVIAKTPNLQAGDVGVRVVIGTGTSAKYSNFLSLNVISSSNQNLRISYIEPTSGPAGSYVTIYGNGFGGSRNNSNVEFKLSANNWVDGNFNFPADCSTNYWSDNKIIVKVPQDFANISANSAVRVLVNNATSTEVAFQVNTNGIPPSICGMLPASGTQGDDVKIFGEYFGNNSIAAFNYLNGSGTEASTTESTANSITVTVPETQTGPVAVRNSNGYGNTINFEYTSGIITPPSEFDFYGWHFKTCETCGIPRVKMETCSTTGNSSPSPFPGYSGVPVDMNIYAEFEYTDKTQARMNQATLNNSNIKVYKCVVDTHFEDAEPVCDIPVSFHIETTQDSVQLNPDSNLDPNSIYKVVFSSDIEDLEGSNLIPFPWFFTTSVTGGLCQMDRLRVYPDNASVPYVSNGILNYFTQLWDTNGCYQCSNNYSYEWTKEDTTNLVSWLNAGSNSASTTRVRINSDGKTGELDISAKNTTFTNLTDSSHLTIRTDCGSFNSEPNLHLRQDGCVENNCCWNASTYQCLNDGNAVCNSPFIKHENCVTNTNSATSTPIMGSPSPKSTNTYTVPVNANILAKFSKRGGTVSMNTSTYEASGAIKIYQCNPASQTLNLASCTNDVTSSLRPRVAGSSNSFQVEYYTAASDFLPGFWYKVVLTDQIKDSTGQSLQEEYWTFKTGSLFCVPNSMSVEPRNKTLGLNLTQEYVANCFDGNCTICDDRYSYSWEISDTHVANFEGSLTDDILLNITNTTTVKTLGIGTTKVRATNLSIANLTNFATLKVTNTGNDAECNTFATLNSCNDSGHCCWNAVTSKCVDGTNNPACGGPFNITNYSPTGNNICPNTVISMSFDSVLNYSSLQNKILIKSDSGQTVDFNYHTYSNELGNSVLVIEPITALNSSSAYKVFVSKGIKSQSGGLLNCPLTIDDRCFSWEFKTTDSICSLNSINIVSPEDKFYEFNESGEEYVFESRAISSNGQIIHPIAGVYSWALNWESKDTTLVDIKSGASPSLGSVPFVAKNKNGKTTVTVTAKKLANPVGYNGPDLSDQASVEVFLCEDPWTSLMDGEYNFSMKYCQDGNLPDLYVKPNPNVSGGLLKEYILTYNNSASAFNSNNPIKKFTELSSNSFMLNIFARVFGPLTNKFFGAKVFAQVDDNHEQDVIGVRIYKNEKHLSPIDWYHKSGYITFIGKPKATVVDSYNAIKDGTTIYVNAGNKSRNRSEDGPGDLEVILFNAITPPHDPGDDEQSLEDYSYNTYVYLISYNSNASGMTKGIVAQLINNWKLNTNINDVTEKNNLVQDVKRWEDIRTIEASLDNYAENNTYCAYTSNPVGGYCSETVDLSYTWRDDNGDGVINNGECYNVSNEVKCSDDDYCQNHKMKFNKCITKYPELNSGTYKKGISVSVWPSWKDTLSDQVGASLPIDPVNKMGAGCYGDPTTCWDAVNNTFQCPINSQVYYYRSKSGGGFEFYTLFNNKNINNWGGNNHTSHVYNAFFIDNSAVCNNSISGCRSNDDCSGDCAICNTRTHECESKCRGNTPYCIDPATKTCGQCTNAILSGDQCTEPCTTCNTTTHNCVSTCDRDSFCLDDTCVDCLTAANCTGDCEICSHGSCVSSCTTAGLLRCVDNSCKQCSPATEALDCLGACQECNANNSCAYKCNTEPNLKCWNNGCVECLGDNDCSEKPGTPRCETNTHTCVPCTNSTAISDCGSCSQCIDNVCSLLCPPENCVNNVCSDLCNSNDDCPDGQYCQFNGNCNLNYFGQYINNCNPSPNSWSRTCAPALNCRTFVNNTLSDVVNINVFRETPTCNSIIQSGCLNQIEGIKTYNLKDIGSGLGMASGQVNNVIFGHIPSNTGFINLREGCLYNFTLSVPGYVPFSITKTRFSSPVLGGGMQVDEPYRIYLQPLIGGGG